jgi:hypothetical protein
VPQHRRVSQRPGGSRARLRAGRARAQAACLLLGDAVGARVHWPRNADLRVNNMQYRPYGRQANAKLGGSARDEPASIGTLAFHGRNVLQLSAGDCRPFCLVLQARGRLMVPARGARALRYPGAAAAAGRRPCMSRRALAQPRAS